MIAHPVSYRLQTLFLAITVGLLTMAFSLAKTGRDALFLSGPGLFQLPLAYLLIALVSVPAALLLVKAQKAWGTERARIGALLVTAMLLLAFGPSLRNPHHPAQLTFFILLPTLFGLLFAGVWTLAAHLFEGAPETVTARAFGRISASAMGGGIVGGLLAKGMAPYLSPDRLVSLAGCVLLLALLIVLHAHRAFFTLLERQTLAPEVSHSRGARVVPNGYPLKLLLISMAGALTGILIDFQFFMTASGAHQDPRAYTGFFAGYYTLLYGAALLLQIFLTPAIQVKMGIWGGLLILPLALLGGSLFVTASASAMGGAFLKVAEGGLKGSIHRPFWEQAFIPVPEADRPLVKIVVDSVGTRVAEGFGAVIVSMWITRVCVVTGSIDTACVVRNNAWMPWLVVLTVLVWVLLTSSLRSKRQALPSNVVSYEPPPGGDLQKPPRRGVAGQGDP